MSKPLRYFIDLDNTLCLTQNGDYSQSIPIRERIEKVNKLKQDNHFIVIWTARGSRSKVDYTELTTNQLKEWGVLYDELLMGKPDYDLYIDDKSFNVNDYWALQDGDTSSTNDTSSTSKRVKTTKPEIVEKGWGKEIIFVNHEEYCGKILCFEKEKKFSMHYHIQKRETWYVTKGRLQISYIDTQHGQIYQDILQVGDVINIERGVPHQLYAIEDSEIFEVSTKHYDEDSYRVWKGD